MRRVRLEIRGVVQGVSYRASAVDAAARLGLTGWVENRPDGGVVLEAQGAPARVDELVAWCEHGPPHARVAAVEVRDVDLISGERGFKIRR